MPDFRKWRDFVWRMDMKKKCFSVAAILMCFLMIMPTMVSAQTYAVEGTDLSITIDDTAWYILTRDNIENNAELADLGIAYESIHDFMYSNDVYMDAVAVYDDTYVELFLRKVEGDGGMNLSEFSDDEVLETIEAMAEQCGSTEYGIYQTAYKFSKMEYSQAEFHIMEYITIVNGDTYTLGFQSNAPFGDWAYEEMDRIVDSVAFKIETTDENRYDNDTAPYEDRYDDVVVSDDVEIPERSSGAAVLVSAVVSGVAWMLRRNKKEENGDPTEEQPVQSADCSEEARESDKTEI